MAGLWWRCIEWWRGVRCGNLQACEVLLSIAVLAFTRSGLRIGVTDLAEEVRTLHVEVVALVEVFLGCALEVFQDHDTCAWDQNVDFAEFADSLGNHGFNVFDTAGISFDEERVLVADLVGNILGCASV